MNIAYYEFPDYDDRERAVDKIYSECGGYKAYDKSGSEGLYITDDGDNVSLAARICEANGGRRR